MSATLVFTPIVHGPHDGRPSDGNVALYRTRWAAVKPWRRSGAWYPCRVASDSKLATERRQRGSRLAEWISQRGGRCSGDRSGALAGFFPSTTPVVAYPDPTQPPPLDGNTVWYDAAATASYTRQAVATAGTAVIGLDPNVPAPGLVAPIIVGGGLQSRVVPPPSAASDRAARGAARGIFYRSSSDSSPASSGQCR
jgi:hypothetical protein